MKIKDEGIGITKNDIPFIFDRFYQVKSNNKGSSIGTGIGLALSKELVEQLNGKIEVQSLLNHGSTFTTTIPISNKAIRKSPKLEGMKRQKEKPLLSSSFKTSKSVDDSLALIVEDNHDVATVIGLSIDHSYEIIFAKDGEDGWDKAVTLLPDIIICDLMMPKKDGYTLLKELKNDNRTNHIPIILLTARVTDHDKVKGLEHGADAYLTKPFKKTELLAKMQQLIKQRDRLVDRFGGSTLSHLLSIKNGDIKMQFIQHATKMVINHINDADFNPSKLAKLLHLSESQVYRKLKSLTDKSTAIFIRSVKLRVAHDLLLRSNSTVSEVAYQVGFNDLSYFNRVFKAEYGVTPGRLRKT